MLNILKVTFVIIGTIIGAGFSSGQEILTFFNQYGIYGIVGLVISLSLISVIIYKTLKINLENNVNNYQGFIESIMPQKLKDNKVLVFTVNNIIDIFLLISFNVMVSRIFYIFCSRIFYSKNNRKFNNCNYCFCYIFKKYKWNCKNKHLSNTHAFNFNYIFGNKKNMLIYYNRIKPFNKLDN